jgi:hypothetical protein
MSSYGLWFVSRPHIIINTRKARNMIIILMLFQNASRDDNKSVSHSDVIAIGLIFHMRAQMRGLLKFHNYAFFASCWCKHSTVHDEDNNVSHSASIVSERRINNAQIQWHYRIYLSFSCSYNENPQTNHAITSGTFTRICSFTHDSLSFNNISSIHQVHWTIIVF